MKNLLDILPVYGVEHDAILSKMGDITVAFEVDLPELFTMSNDDYEAFHHFWIKAIKVLPVNAMKSTLKLAGSIVLIGGGPEDPVTDVGALVVIIGGGIYATWLSAIGINNTYPEPYTYTYRIPSQDPIHRPLGGDPQEPPSNMRGWFRLMSVGGLIYSLYEKYDKFREDLKAKPK